MKRHLQRTMRLRLGVIDGTESCVERRLCIPFRDRERDYSQVTKASFQLMCDRVKAGISLVEMAERLTERTGRIWTAGIVEDLEAGRKTDYEVRSVENYYAEICR